ncbi:unnamed protein product [Calicophoron daubneyi]|uniref:MYND-type domain-containing protein n=1 Tax=Calicophoron daubneyi TaxID=300641 RepID=A0AAV2TA52_CALDB
MSNAEIFHEAAAAGEIEKVKALLSMDKCLVNSLNKDGMSPLQQACFRGHVNTVEYLLENGADVNSKDPKQGYTSLMFAGLAGNLDIVEMLLQHGARTNYTNSVGRTAAQMAAFVGNHRVVTLINNFVEKEEVDRYTMSTTPSDLKLHPKVAYLLYRLIIGLNISPIKVFLMMESNLPTSFGSRGDSSDASSTLLGSYRSIVHVLEDLGSRYFTPHQTHEALALKFHLFACCFRRAGEFYESLTGNATNEPKENSKENPARSPLRGLIREFLRGTDPHGLPLALGQEKFLRQVIASFGHQESTLWRYVVNQIGPVKLGYSPTALSILRNAISGQGPVLLDSDASSEPCTICGDGPECGKEFSIKLCHNCKEVGYCSVKCQRLHWFTHKQYCPILKKNHDAMERSQKKLVQTKSAS